MGCAFNMYSSSWSDRSYGITLFLYCWIVPLVIIFFSYIGMIYDTRTSRKKLIRSASQKPENVEDPKDESKLKRTGTNQSYHSPQRVSSPLLIPQIWFIVPLWYLYDFRNICELSINIIKLLLGLNVFKYFKYYTKTSINYQFNSR